MSDEKTGFASRWSKRKIANLEDNPCEEVINDELQSDLSESEVDSVDTSTEPELLTEEDFEDVDFEALDKSSDYTRFIKSNVPAAIQQKALRKLWDSDSVFEVLDGMNDYDEDFTGNGLAGKVIKTAYKVGRGFLENDDEVEIVKIKNSDTDAELHEDMQTVETDSQSEDTEEIQRSEDTDQATDDGKTALS